VKKRRRAESRQAKPEEPREADEIQVTPEEVAGALWAEAVPSTQPPIETAAQAPAADAVPARADLAPEVERLKAESAEYLDGWQRARAEFANYKKRIEREQEESRSRVAADILTRYVGVLDDLERALKDRPKEGEPAAWASGIDLIYRKWLAILEAEGVLPILPEGQTFDPNFHEAVSHETSDEHTEGQIIEVLHQGYRLGDRVLRPARVRVAK
jgi:molecular chaperone GrpE